MIPKQLFLLIVIIATIHIIQIKGVRRFFNGRPYRGFVGAPSAEESGSHRIKPQWFTQKLDNFNESDTRTWQNRYLVRDHYFKTGGPIFLMLRGEDSLSTSFMYAGAWINYAKKYGAYLFQLEHRFYGESFPTNDMSVESLKYLTVKQALADTANFIRQSTTNYMFGPDQKWIIFGGSYSGALAVWMAEQYPDIVYGVISSSAPINLQLDFKEYLVSISSALAKYSQECSTQLAEGVNELQQRTTNEKGLYSLYNSLVLCNSAVHASKMDISNLLYSIAGDFMNVVQYSGDNTGGLFTTISDVCKVLTDTSIGTPFDRLARVNSMILTQEKDGCLDFKYDRVIRSMSNSSLNSGEVKAGNRQWIYETCNDLGFFQTSDSKKQDFGDDFSLDFFFTQCSDIFGSEFTPEYITNRVTTNQKIYHGVYPNATNVLCIQGTADPWHTVGYISNNTAGVESLLIPGTAHCADMYSPQPSDPPQLTEARAIIMQYIGNILNASPENSNESPSKSSQSNSYETNYNYNDNSYASNYYRHVDNLNEPGLISF